MLFNKYLNYIDGSKYDWKKSYIYSIVNILFWIALIVLSFLANKWKDKWMKFKITSLLFLFIIQMIALLSMFITAPEEAKRSYTFFYSGEKQYNVATEENVIVFVLDAVDNRYINELLSKDDSYFEEFCDFTLYDNTCSVYDYTLPSMAQMLTGYCYEDNDIYDEKELLCNEYYRRIKEAGYVMNFYGYDDCPDFPQISSYIDNCEKAYLNNKSEYVIDYEHIRDNFTLLSIYQILPCIFKSIIEVNNLSFDVVSANGSNSKYFYNNDDYLNNLDLKVDENIKKLYLVEHLSGAHFPCEDYVETTKYCLDICGNYINQLKVLNKYNEATIIITADHGLHDQHEPYTFPTAGTPIFMIKESGKYNSEMRISHAPICHTDYMSTILVEMNLFEDADREKYGTPIFDYDDKSDRKRVWYDTKDNGYYRYEYIGNTDTLEECVELGNYDYVEY